MVIHHCIHAALHAIGEVNVSLLPLIQQVAKESFIRDLASDDFLSPEMATSSYTRSA